MAGTLYVDGRIPGQIVGTPTIETSDSSGFTSTETVLLSVTVPVVEGRTYSVHAYLKLSSTVDNDDVRVAIRQDSSSGAFVQIDRQELDVDNQSTQGQTSYLQAFYVADATEDKTFVVTGVQDTGTGTITMVANALSRPAMLYVRYELG